MRWGWLSSRPWTLPRTLRVWWALMAPSLSFRHARKCKAPTAHRHTRPPLPGVWRSRGGGLCEHTCSCRTSCSSRSLGRFWNVPSQMELQIGVGRRVKSYRGGGSTPSSPCFVEGGLSAVCCQEAEKRSMHSTHSAPGAQFGSGAVRDVDSSVLYVCMQFMCVASYVASAGCARTVHKVT